METSEANDLMQDSEMKVKTRLTHVILKARVRILLRLFGICP